MNEAFGERLRRMRSERGLTQQATAAAAGISPHYRNDVELGRRDCPPIDTARRLAAALGCEVIALDPLVRVPMSWVTVPAGRFDADGDDPWRAG